MATWNVCNSVCTKWYRDTSDDLLIKHSQSSGSKHQGGHLRVISVSFLNNLPGVHPLSNEFDALHKHAQNESEQARPKKFCPKVTVIKEVNT